MFAVFVGLVDQSKRLASDLDLEQPDGNVTVRPARQRVEPLFKSSA